MKIQKHIEIVRSTTPGLSSIGETSCRSVYNLLRSIYATVGITILNNEEDLAALVARQPDLVFVGMKFVPRDENVSVWDSPKIWVTQYLDEHNIAYTGSGFVSHALELDKSLAKQRVLSAGLLTSPYSVIRRNATESSDFDKLTYPLFVKPTNRGGGLGVDSNSLVHSPQALQLKAQSLSDEFNTDSLVEEYLPGREFSVAILKDEFAEGNFLLMPLELIAPINKRGIRILSDEVKSADVETFIAVPQGALRQSITALALNAFHALGAQDYGRIDIRLDGSGTPHFLEANLIPSLLDGYGNFPKACLLNAGIDYKSMILRIVRLGLNRSKTGKVILPDLEPALFPSPSML